MAATIEKDGAAPASTGDFTPKEVSGEYTEYTEATNRFDDGKSALDAANFNFSVQFSDGNVCSISSKAAASEALSEAVKVYETSVGNILEKRSFFQWLKRA